ncbi:MAG: hypothetical protein PHQ58_16210 [Rhodoferax sp.]|uniref:hypothetical protein n=1 Tax=Rhodoferax sp. TaxID=50421 RepID=UPI00260D6EE7|nr:hypothetical protein [Rhodoferax sp.]MDD2881972.1 hypothetical protein [Rhodoferax sp.]
MDIKAQLAQEWTTLQNNHEAYERSALALKLVATLLTAAAWVYGLDPLALGALVLILWAQEAVLKTWQNRLVTRLVDIEAMFRRGAQGGDEPFQLHSQWLATRPGLMGLLADYARSALRPTVAWPYAALLLLLLLVYL